MQTVPEDTASTPGESNRRPSDAHAAFARDITTMARFDFPEGAPLKLVYMVAATRRSGSTFLCRNLWQTGVMGTPWEYFSYRHTMVEMIVRLGTPSIPAYTKRLLALRTSPNGVFGFKAMFDHLQFMALAQIRFTPLRVVYLTRRDRVAQAVSMDKMMQGWQDNSLMPAPLRPLTYDFKRIHGSMRHIAKHSAAWEEWFRQNGIQPIRVGYEELAAAPDGVVGGIMALLGVSPDPAMRLELPPVERQSDGTNAEWISRFRRDATARSIAIPEA